MKSKIAWVPFVPLALLAGFLKLAQELLPEGAVLGLSALQLDYLYMGAVALIFLFALLFCLLDKRIASYYSLRRNIPAGLAGLVLAVLLAADGANSIFRLFGGGKVDALGILEAVLLLLSAVVFIVLGLNHTFRAKDSKRFTLFNVMPALLCAVRMILCFVSFTTISIRLADVSSLICYVFATLFFYHYAVALSFIKTKNAVRSCLLFGLPAVAAMVPYGVYHLLFDFDGEEILNNLYPAQTLLMGLYILFFLIELTAFVRDRDDLVVIEKEELVPEIVDGKIEGFLANAVEEDENDSFEDTTFMRNSDTEGYLVTATTVENPEPQDADAVNSEVESYLTDVVKEEDEDENDDRPKDYESRLDEIDKLILEINSQSD